MNEKGYWGHYCLVCQANQCIDCRIMKMTYEPLYFDPLNEESIMDMEERLTICRCRNCNKKLEEGIIYNSVPFCDEDCVGQHATCGEYK